MRETGERLQRLWKVVVGWQKNTNTAMALAKSFTKDPRLYSTKHLTFNIFFNLKDEPECEGEWGKIRQTREEVVFGMQLNTNTTIALKSTPIFFSALKSRILKRFAEEQLKTDIIINRLLNNHD